jgi:hypothetical protein
MAEWLSVLGDPPAPPRGPAHSEGLVEIYGAENSDHRNRISVLLRNVSEAVHRAQDEHSAGTLSSLEVKDLIEAASALAELEGTGQIVPAGMTAELAKKFL